MCIQNIEWWLIVRQEWVLGAGLGKRKHCDWVFNMSLRSGLFQLLEGHASREVKHGRFDTWEEVSRVLRTVVSIEP